MPIAGLSAGAICWFDEMYTDSEILEGNSTSYKLMPAMGILEGTACPHYDERQTDFDEAILSGKAKRRTHLKICRRKCSRAACP